MKYFRIFSFPKIDPSRIEYGNSIKNVEFPDGTFLSDVWRKECEKFNTPENKYVYGLEVGDVSHERSKPKA